MHIDGIAALGEGAGQRRDEERRVRHVGCSGLRDAPRRSARWPQVFEAENDQLPDHGRAAGLVEPGIARGVYLLDHLKREADLDEFQALDLRFRRAAASASRRAMYSRASKHPQTNRLSGSAFAV